MTDLYLARHAESTHGGRGVIKGHLDVPLSERGIQQAELVAERLATDDIAAIYSSTLIRSLQTAEIIAEPHGLTPETVSDFRERCFGDAEGEAVEQIKRELEAAEVQWNEWCPNGGETRKDVVERGRPALESVCEDWPDETIVVVAHGGFNCGIIADVLCGQPRFGYRIAQDHTCLNHLSFDPDEGNWHIHTINDTAHRELLLGGD